MKTGYDGRGIMLRLGQDAPKVQPQPLLRRFQPSPPASRGGGWLLAMCILLMAGAPLAVDAKQHTIAVLDSVNQLVYGSLSVPSDRQVSFEVLRNGERVQNDGRLPERPSQRQRSQQLDAACQVAFGPG